MKLKVCGMTRLEQVRSLAAMGVDYAGFIFYPASPRFVVGKVLSEEMKSLQGLKKTGVFVNDKPGRVLSIVEEYGLDAIQLHGDEDESYLDEMGSGVEIIKVVKMGDQSITGIQKTIESFAEKTTYYLLETQSPGHGASGKKFDWSMIGQLHFPKPFFLSGGITEYDGAAIKSIAENQPMLLGADINSRFESEPGIKNLELVKQFRYEIA